MFVAGTTGSIITTTPATVGLGEGIRILYTLLRASPEFKLLFADRIQRHFFNDGALTESRMLAEWNALKSEFAPLIAPTAVNDKVTPWLNGVGDATRYTTSGSTTVNAPSRRNVLFNGYTDDTAGGTLGHRHLAAEGLWPATRAPGFPANTAAPSPPASPSASATPTPPAPSTSPPTGLDPRAEGGAIVGTSLHRSHHHPLPHHRQGPRSQHRGRVESARRGLLRHRHRRAPAVHGNHVSPARPRRDRWQINTSSSKSRTRPQTRSIWAE